jgi:hypothetical protein
MPNQPKIICRSCGAGFAVTVQSLQAVPPHQVRSSMTGVQRACPGVGSRGKLNRAAGTGATSKPVRDGVAERPDR